MFLFTAADGWETQPPPAMRRQVEYYHIWRELVGTLIIIISSNALIKVYLIKYSYTSLFSCFLKCFGSKK